MGLEICYDLHAPAFWPDERVREVVEQIHEFALTLGFAEADPVRPNDPKNPRTLVVKESEGAGALPSVQATEGWYFRTWPGKGCETAFFGLCRFRGTVVVDGVEIPTGWGEGWHFHTCCKTQYADRVSREHFMKCHLGVIAILDAFRTNGAEVNVRDGSGYWEHRNDGELAKQLDEWNGIVAAVAGAIKDAADGCEGRVVAPILNAPDFEHLEAQGHEVIQRKRQKTAEAESSQEPTEDL